MPHLLGSLNLVQFAITATTIAGGIAAAISLWLYYRDRQTKKLSYRCIARPIEARDNFDLKHEGQPVHDASHVQWTLTNCGTTSIERTDYDRSVRLQLGAGSRPLGALIVMHQYPPGLNPRVVVDGSSLVLRDQLLNPRDTFTVSAIVSNYQGPLRLEGRIAGIRSFIDAQRRERQQALALRLAVVLCVALASTLAAVLLAGPRHPRSAASPSDLGLAVRSWGVVGTPYRGQYQFVLGVNAYATSPRKVDIRLSRFRLLISTLDVPAWQPPGPTKLLPRQLNYHGRRVWALPATPNGVSTINPTTGTRTLPSLWSTRVLERGQSYPARPPDGVMTFYVPRHDVIDKGAFHHVIGLAYVSAQGSVIRVNEPSAWGPRRLPTQV